MFSDCLIRTSNIFRTSEASISSDHCPPSSYQSNRVKMTDFLLIDLLQTLTGNWFDQNGFSFVGKQYSVKDRTASPTFTKCVSLYTVQRFQKTKESKNTLYTLTGTSLMIGTHSFPTNCVFCKFNQLFGNWSPWRHDIMWWSLLHRAWCNLN